MNTARTPDITLITTRPFDHPVDHEDLQQQHFRADNPNPYAVLYTTEENDQGVIINFDTSDMELLSGFFHSLFLNHDAKWADLYLTGLSNKSPNDEKHVQFAIQAGLVKSRSELPHTQPALLHTQFTPKHTVMSIYPINNGVADFDNPLQQTVLDDPTLHPLGIMPFQLI